VLARVTRVDRGLGCEHGVGGRGGGGGGVGRLHVGRVVVALKIRKTREITFTFTFTSHQKGACPLCLNYVLSIS